jgi:hypothetical protein
MRSPQTSPQTMQSPRAMPSLQTSAGRDSSCQELTAGVFRVTVGNTKAHDSEQQEARRRNKPAAGNHEEER